MFYSGRPCEKHPEAAGLRYVSCRKCVPCHNVDAAKSRRDSVRQATPGWANKFLIGLIYKSAKAQGKVVDHIIPLNHPKVCGLHVSHNLRVVSWSLNLSKGNKFRITTTKGKTK